MSSRPPVSSPIRRVVAAAACAGLTVVIGGAFASLPDGGSALAPLVTESMPGTGVTSRVTAVLLGFRGYDTLLEVTVLLVAALAVRSVTARAVRAPEYVGGPALRALLRLIAPLGVLLAAYLVWRGGHSAGGAFQAAAVLGGSAIALALAGVAVLRAVPPIAVRGLLVVGPSVFLGIGIAGLVVRGELLKVPSGLGAAAITAIEVTLTVSIGLALVFLLGEALPDGEALPGGPAEEVDGPPEGRT